MRDYEQLRRAVERFLNYGPPGGPPCVACFGDRDCCERPRLREALNETSKDSDMERVVEWLKEEQVYYTVNDDGSVTDYSMAMDYVLKHIRTEFGYGDTEPSSAALDAPWDERPDCMP